MCGCRGNYTTTRLGVQRIARRVLHHPKVQMDGEMAWVDVDGRMRVVYFEDEQVISS